MIFSNHINQSPLIINRSDSIREIRLLRLPHSDIDRRAASSRRHGCARPTNALVQKLNIHIHSRFCHFVPSSKARCPRHLAGSLVIPRLVACGEHGAEHERA